MLNGYIAYIKRSKQGADEPGANHVIHELPENYFVESPNLPLQHD